MEQLVMYRETTDEFFNCSITQDIYFIYEKSKNKTVIELVSTIRDTDWKYLYHEDARPLREAKSFDDAVTTAKQAGFKQLEHIDTLMNIFREFADIYETEDEKFIAIVRNFITEKFETEDDVVSFLYKNGFRF